MTASTPPAKKRTVAAWIAQQIDDIRHENAVSLAFQGKGLEFLKIWFANLLLSILTLGIYSAWAKVRNKQYFYRSTSVDGTHFNYDADPLKILKGRLLVLSVFVLIYALSMLDPMYSAALSGSIALLMPLFIHRSLRFNAHHTRYRNLRFKFTGRLREAFFIVFLLPLLFGLSSAGLGALSQHFASHGFTVMTGVATVAVYAFFFVPYLLYRYKKYVVSNSWYGNSQFRFATPYREFCYLITEIYGWILLGGLLLFFVFPVEPQVIRELLSTGDFDSVPTEQWLKILPSVLILSVLPLFLYVLYIVRTNNMVLSHASIDGAEFQGTYTPWSYARLWISNTLILIFTCGLFLPVTRVRSARYKAQHTRVIMHDSLDHFVSANAAGANALGEAVGDYLDMDFGF